MSKTPIPDIKSSEIVYEGYFDVIVDHVQAPQGKIVTYTKLNLKAQAAAVIARTKEGLFIVTREYRHPLGKWVIGCPGGRIDVGESPIEAGKRELLEETGYSGEKFSLLGSFYPLPAVTDQQIFYVLAEEVSYQGPAVLEPLELIHTELKTEKELMDLIASGAPVDGIFCAGLYFLRKNV